MRLCLVGAGASFSTKDVETGYLDALRRAGHEVYHYNLDGRINAAGGWLNHAWRAAGKPTERPTAADILYLAASGTLEKALRHEVDWVLVISGMFLHPDWLILLRRAGLLVGLLLTESPYDQEQEAKIAPLANVCWTNERTSVAYLRHFNPRTFYLPHAYDPARHNTLGSTNGDKYTLNGDVPMHDVVFVGTGFAERIEVLQAVDWNGIDLGLYGAWPLLGSRSHLRKHLRGGPIDNARTAALYRRASLGLNLYRTSMGFGRDAPRIGGAESLNPRAVELAACGSFTLSDYRAEVGETFGPLVPTFHTPRELQELIRYYLSPQGDIDRGATAPLLPARVADRTFDRMADRLIEDVRRITYGPLSREIRESLYVHQPVGDGQAGGIPIQLDTQPADRQAGDDLI